MYLRKQLKKKYQFNQIIGTAAKMQALFKMVERVADTDSTILILGESGTGKELVARALHFNSRRQFAPFIPVNCSALPENLLESELFGHRKGAFTGAVADKKGLFQEADGGTIFLDEIGSMPPVLQSRLLRVLQEKEVRRVGENVPVYVNVRVLAATNEPLEQRVKDGTFREDLYYRLNVIPLTLPNLRERKDDIPLLVSHFVRDKVNPRTGQPFQVTRQAMQVLSAHDWPGNVRELENAIERACALAETSVIQAADLPPSLLEKDAQTPAIPETLIEPTAVIKPLECADSDSLYPLETATAAAAASANSGPPSPSSSPLPLLNESIKPLKIFLREQEQSYLNRALSFTAGDKEKAAELLNVSLATLYRKLAEDSESSS